jgi:Tol biopolymer transport system component
VTTGDPQALTAPAPYVADFSLSADGAIAAYSSLLLTANIGRVDFDAQSATTRGAVIAVTSGTNEFTAFDATSDGRSIVAAATRGPQEHLYIVPLERGAMRRVTSDTARDRVPRLTQDGRQILFYSDRSGPFEIWRIDTDGGGLQQLTTSGLTTFPVPSRDGTACGGRQSEPATDVNLRRPRFLEAPGDFAADQRFDSVVGAR